MREFAIATGFVICFCNAHVSICAPAHLICSSMLRRFLISAMYQSLLLRTCSAHASCFALAFSLLPAADIFASQVCSFLRFQSISFFSSGVCFGCTRFTMSTSLIAFPSVRYLASWYASNLSKAFLNHFLTAFSVFSVSSWGTLC